MTDSTAPTPKINGVEMTLEFCIQACKDYRGAVAEIKARGEKVTPKESDLKFIEVLGGYLSQLAALRASQPVAEGVGRSARVWEAIARNLGGECLLGETPRLSADELEEAVRIFETNLPTPKTFAAPAPEGGTLPPGCPETAHWGSVGMVNGEKSTPQLHYNGEYWNENGYSLVPVEIHPLGTRSSLRAADLGRGAGDTDLLDALARESWDLRCFDIPTGGGDADIGWRIVGHFMGEPQERVIAEVYEDDPRAAIRAALPSAPQLKGGGDGV